MHSRHLNTIFVGIIFAIMVERVAALGAFTWGPGISATDLKQCTPFAMRVAASPGGTLNPPFYLIAYEPGGQTTVTNIGSTPTTLSWTVNHPAGSKVIVEVVDSLGNSGGVGPHVYPVNAGTSNTCLTPGTSPIQITTNATNLATCDFLDVRISGGTKPYTVSFVGVDSNSAINAKMGPNDNEYIWVNRIDPSTSHALIAVVSDANGVYSEASPLIATTGSKDLTCGSEQSRSLVNGGVVTSSSGISSTSTSTSPTQSIKTKRPSSSTSSTPVRTSGTSTPSGTNKSAGGIAGGIIGGLVAAALFAAIAFLLLKRRRERGLKKDYGIDVFYGGSKPESHGLADESFGNRERNQPITPQGEYTPGYGWSKGDEARPPSDLGAYNTKYSPTPSSSIGSETYHEMSPPTSATKLAGSAYQQPIRSPPQSSPDLYNPYTAAGYYTNPGYPTHAPHGYDNLPKPVSSVFRGHGRNAAQQPSIAQSDISSYPTSYPSTMIGPLGGNGIGNGNGYPVALNRNVPTIMRSLQPQQGGGRASSSSQPTPQQEQQEYLSPSAVHQPQGSTQRAATPSSSEPASVVYARERNSILSNSNTAVSTSTSNGSGLSAQITHVTSFSQPVVRSRSSLQSPAKSSIRRIPPPSSNLQTQIEAKGAEEESLLAYRNSTASDEEKRPESPLSSYPPTIKPESPSGGQPSKPIPPVPPIPEPRVHQHEDGGPVFEVPPAYRSKYPHEFEQLTKQKSAT